VWVYAQDASPVSLQEVAGVWAALYLSAREGRECVGGEGGEIPGR